MVKQNAVATLANKQKNDGPLCAERRAILKWSGTEFEAGMLQKEFLALMEANGVEPGSYARISAGYHMAFGPPFPGDPDRRSDAKFGEVWGEAEARAARHAVLWLAFREEVQGTGQKFGISSTVATGSSHSTVRRKSSVRPSPCASGKPAWSFRAGGASPELRGLEYQLAEAIPRIRQIVSAVLSTRCGAGGSGATGIVNIRCCRFLTLLRRFVDIAGMRNGVW